MIKIIPFWSKFCWYLEKLSTSFRCGTQFSHLAYEIYIFFFINEIKYEIWIASDSMGSIYSNRPVPKVQIKSLMQILNSSQMTTIVKNSIASKIQVLFKYSKNPVN